MKKSLLSSFLFLTSLLLVFQMVSPLVKASELTINNNIPEKSYSYVVSILSSDGESGQIKKIEQIIQKRLL
jgi:hypothetical protein